MIVERTGTNEESIHLAGVGATLVGWVRVGHASRSYVTRKSTYFDLVQKFIALINEPGETVAGRYGPDQSGVIVASLDITLGIRIEFKSATGATSRYGKLGNLDRVFVACGRTLGGVDQNGVGQGFYWTEGNGANVVFAGGDNDTKYHVALNFAALTDKTGQAVPMNTCRKIYMVFAPRFEAAEAELQDGCFLSAGVNAAATVWSVDDSVATHWRAVLHRRRSQRGAVAAGGGGPRTGHRPAWVRGHDGAVLAGWRADEEALAHERVRVRRGVGRDHLEHRGHGRRQPQGGRRGGADRGGRRAVQVHRLLGGLQVRRGRLALAVVEHGPRDAHRASQRRATSGRSRSPIRRRRCTTSTSGTFLNTDCGKVARLRGRRGHRRTISISTSSAARRRT